MFGRFLVEKTAMEVMAIPRLVGTIEQLRHYADLFVGRWSDFAVQTGNGRYTRVGRPLTLDDILKHFHGLHTLGTYLMDDEGMCRCCVFDDDSDHGLLLLS